MISKRFSVGFLVIALLFSSVVPGLACSSYAIYSNETIYGMNFDWGPTECRFSIEEIADLRYFILRFNFAGRPVAVASMTSKGFFANYQAVPYNRYKGKYGASTVPLYQIWGGAIAQKSSVNGVEELIGDKIVTPVPGIALHSMFADLNGDALILEILEQDHNIIKNDKNFMVMTNFFNSDYVGVDYKDITGIGGVDRYQIIYEEILKNMGSFDLDIAFNILKKATQLSTRVSMVFYPEDLAVYLALEGDFDRIWKIDIMDGTIETYQGFKEFKQVAIADHGVTATELLFWR